MSTPEWLRLLPASDHSVILYVGQEISDEARSRVMALVRELEREPAAFVRNIQPAYCSLMLDYDPRIATERAVIEYAVELAGRAAPSRMLEANRVDIPVAYGGASGPDLEAVADHAGLSLKGVIELHSSTDYIVHFIGFSPGFAYLGGMSPRLASPRLRTPRTRVPAGSIAIGGLQTGIYSHATPGGWRIIGRTSLNLFDVRSNRPCALSIGDRVRFVPGV